MEGEENLATPSKGKSLSVIITFILKQTVLSYIVFGNTYLLLERYR